jgi:hypothetical protein
VAREELVALAQGRVPVPGTRLDTRRAPGAALRPLDGR